jgi:hypothetical protein
MNYWGVYIMPKFPNQESVTMGKREKRDKEHPYCMMNLQAIQDALINIRSVGGMKLWIYLNKNSDNYVVDLSRAELTKHWGFTKDTYLKAKSELKELGYLVPVNGSDYLFTFNESLSENPTQTDDLSEKQTELIVDMLLSENPTKEQETSENPTNVDVLEENPTIVYHKDFIF